MDLSRLSLSSPELGILQVEKLTQAADVGLGPASCGLLHLKIPEVDTFSLSERFLAVLKLISSLIVQPLDTAFLRRVTLVIGSSSWRPQLLVSWDSACAVPARSRRPSMRGNLCCTASTSALALRFFFKKKREMEMCNAWRQFLTLFPMIIKEWKKCLTGVQ